MKITSKDFELLEIKNKLKKFTAEEKTIIAEYTNHIVGVVLSGIQQAQNRQLHDVWSHITIDTEFDIYMLSDEEKANKEIAKEIKNKEKKP